jgi:hypothetical protein
VKKLNSAHHQKQISTNSFGGLFPQYFLHDVIPGWQMTQTLKNSLGISQQDLDDMLYN